MKAELRPIPARARAGFSLMEILIVVFIIALLGGLVVAVGYRMTTSAKSKGTKVILAALKAVADEYEVQTKGGRVNHVGAFPIDWTRVRSRNAPGASGTAVISGAVADRSAERFVSAAWQFETCRKMLPTVGQNAFVDADGNGFQEVRDTFGNKVIYAGMVSHTDNESSDDFLPEHNYPYFASAGPDGQWGDVRTTASAQDRKYAEDNVYSYTTE